VRVVVLAVAVLAAVGAMLGGVVAVLGLAFSTHEN
jgi:hypothetical protein